LNRQASHSGPIKTPESWLDDAPPAALPYPGVEIFDVWAEQGTSKLMVLLASDHEDLSTFGMRAKLLGPAGSKPSSYDTTIASPLLKVVRRKGYMLLELKTPNPGKWQIQLNVPNIAGVTAQQSGYITVLNRSPNARLATDISRTVVSQPGQPVVVRAYPRWASSNLFGANVEANLVAPDGLVTPLTVEGGDDPTTAYRVHVPPWAIDMQGLFEVRLRVVAAPGTARLSEGEWLPDVPMPVSYVRTASESFVVLPGGCGTPNCGQ
jgi:hypothetical protein